MAKFWDWLLGKHEAERTKASQTKSSPEPVGGMESPPPDAVDESTKIAGTSVSGNRDSGDSDSGGD